MGERIVTIKLIANASGVVQGFNAARDAAGELKEKVNESARSQREDWATVGAGLTAVGAAITGIGILALKTGIQYNTLQQTTRAALSTLLGSAQAANAQMDKLDAFARESPFAKQVFIKAQQQMLGFGVAAQNVIPALDAVQNAVAAMGGSNEQIASIAEIMARIKSEGRLSGDALQRLGYYGIDAAALIGSQMGKTSAQIRDMASKPGGIPVDQVWDPLVSGMQEKFGGAAANVKNTFEGSLDRVKAAWRDFSSDLAKPLVDPDGGGALVDLLNWTADAMRNFQKLPEPVKFTATALTGLAGTAALAGGAFLLAYPKILEFTASLAALGVTSASVKAGMMSTLRFLTGPWGIALMATAITYGVLEKAGKEATTSSDAFTTAMKRQVSVFSEMQSNASKQSDWANDFSASYENLGSVLDQAAKHTSDFSRWWNILWTDRIALDSIKEAGGALAELSQTDLPSAQAAFKKFGEEAKLTRPQLATALEEMPTFKSALVDVANASGLATDDATLLSLALGELKPATVEAAAAAARADSSMIQMADAASAAWKEINSLIDSLNYFNGVGQSAEKQNAKLQETFASVSEYMAKAAEGVEGYSLSLDASTVEGSKNRAMLADLAAQSQATALAIYEQEVSTIGAQEATANYEERLRSGRDQLLAVAQQFGMNNEAAKAFTDTIYKMPGEKEFKVLAQVSAAQATLDSFVDRNSGRSITVNVDLNERVAGYNGPGGITYATGGTVGYAQGGTILKAASGMTIPGIGGGVADGTVWGRGTSKSDSVHVRLSKGEEVIQEPYASLNRPILKAINRGDFHPGMMQPQIIVQGGGRGDISMTNYVTAPERDPRLTFRQIGRELREALS